jgi:hypothetical protein
MQKAKKEGKSRKKEKKIRKRGKAQEEDQGTEMREKAATITKPKC